MKTTVKIFFIFSTWLVLCSIQNRVFANAAQPGIWNAGGTVFTMLYPEDSLTFKKVQMVEEKIYIQLYKGYAVVKGTYVFRNTTKEQLNFKMGYPVNGIYYGGEVDLNEVIIDSLSRFKIKTKNNWIPLLKESHPELHHDYKSPVPDSDNWMVWQMSFAPEEKQLVEVYFIVNTNQAQVRKGYNIEQKNAFIYLLESGSVWHQPIEKGNFYIQLNDQLTLDNINGISSGFGFSFNQKNKIFSGKKVNFSPTPKDNLVINYFEHVEHFSFEKNIKEYESLFSKIDAFSKTDFESLVYEQIKLPDPYQVESTFWGSFPGLLTLFVILAPVLIGIIVLGIIIWAVIKWRKIRKNSKKV